jgi:hypothetical protein
MWKSKQLVFVSHFAIFTALERFYVSSFRLLNKQARRYSRVNIGHGCKAHKSIQARLKLKSHSEAVSTENCINFHLRALQADKFPSQPLVLLFSSPRTRRWTGWQEPSARNEQS